ncbi:hypothetical protein K9M16_02600 [Candidatus Babeliales bacterium]|nr:hypothetical protein [Candidatus Babeliales bacterium]
MIFNSKNFKYSFLIFCFSVFFTNQLFCSNLTDLYHQEYYKNNQWEYLKKIFIDEPQTQKKNMAILRCALFVSIATMSGIIIGKHLSKDEIFIPYTLSLTIGFTILSFYNTKKMNDISSVDIDALIYFLANYSPTLRENELNTKFRLPTRLHARFDSLYNKWLKNDSLFQKKALKTLKSIKEKIMFHLNPVKYRKEKLGKVL